MRLTFLPLLLLAPAATALALPSPAPRIPFDDSPSSASSFVSRVGSLLHFAKRSHNTHIIRPLNGYEDEDHHTPPLPRALVLVLNGTESHDDSDLTKRDRVVREKRTSYPRCSTVPIPKGSMSVSNRLRNKMMGTAHYPGWKLSGDDLSGAVPMSPRRNCAQVCTKYGPACGGIYYDDTKEHCFLKGTQTNRWEFFQTDKEGDGTDLIGGCAAWSQFVPEEMDDVCCRD